MSEAVEADLLQLGDRFILWPLGEDFPPHFINDEDLHINQVRFFNELHEGMFPKAIYVYSNAARRWYLNKEVKDATTWNTMEKP